MTTILFYQEHLFHEKEEGDRRHGRTGSSQLAPCALFFTIVVVVIIPGRPDQGASWSFHLAASIRAAVVTSWVTLGMMGGGGAGCTQGCCGDRVLPFCVPQTLLQLLSQAFISLNLH